jgi:gliding motility-associated-like protein
VFSVSQPHFFNVYKFFGLFSRSTWLSFFVLINSAAFGQRDDVGSGRALSFDGVNDYVDYGNIFDDLTLPLTVSAWINLDGGVTDWTPIFVSQDNGPIYNGFTFIVKPTQLCVAYGDGRGELSPAYRRTLVSNIPDIAGKWVHVTGIIHSANFLELYVNGVSQPGTITGFSDQPMSSSPTDVAKTGLWLSNGLTFRYKGMIDEIRVWNRALTQDEIRSTMCMAPDANGLIGQWSFNETTGSTVIDDSPNHYHGTIHGSTRVFSGAAIGDVSLHNYAGSATTLTFGNKSLSVTPQGVSAGLQLYAVSSRPSQVGGLSLDCDVQPYFGFYPISFGTTYDLVMTGSSLLGREDNSDPLWTMKAYTTHGLSVMTESDTRVELVSPWMLSPDLGPDLIMCDGESRTLVSSRSNGGSWLWNTGATADAITVSNGGIFWLQETGVCGVTRDTVLVAVMTPPAAVDFGTDQICSFVPVELKPTFTTGDGSMEWMNGSESDSLLAATSGTYWVKRSNACGFTSDTVRVVIGGKTVQPPNVITPNGDERNDTFKVELEGKVGLNVFNRWGNEVFNETDYKNDWDGGELSPGVYYYYLTNGCLSTPVSGTLSIVR